MSATPVSLIKRVRNRDDHQSWEQFFQLYQPLVQSYVRKKGVPFADAEDIVADVFARLVRVMPDFTLDAGKGRFRTWLLQVTMSAIGDWWRKKPREAQVNVLPEPFTEGTNEDPGWTDEYRSCILARVLPRIQEQTQEKTWICFIEFVVKNRKAREIAPELGLSPNTVCVHANRVLAKVRNLCLQEYEEDLDED